MLTLADIHELALRWTPRRARMDGLLKQVDHWGPAHELGHALISTQAERDRYLYGLQRRPWRQQAAHELAAMRVSASLLITAGREDLVDAERRWTPMLLETEQAGMPGAHQRLKVLGELPRSRLELERLLKRKLTTRDQSALAQQ